MPLRRLSHMLLDQLANGKQVDFEFMQVDKDYVITGVN